MDDGFGFLADGSLRIPDPDAFPPPASMFPKKGGGCSGGCGGSSATGVADADVVDSIFDEPCCSSCAMGWPCDGTCGGKCGQEQPEEYCCPSCMMGWPCDGTCGGKCGQERPEEHCCPSCMMGWPCEKDADVQARAELFGYTAECVGETCTWEEMGWGGLPSDAEALSAATAETLPCPYKSGPIRGSGSCIGFGVTLGLAKRNCMNNMRAQLLADWTCSPCVVSIPSVPFPQVLPCAKRWNGKLKWQEPQCASHGYFMKLGWLAVCAGIPVSGNVECMCPIDPIGAVSGIT